MYRKLLAGQIRVGFTCVLGTGLGPSCTLEPRPESACVGDGQGHAFRIPIVHIDKERFRLLGLSLNSLPEHPSLPTEELRGVA